MAHKKSKYEILDKIFIKQGLQEGLEYGYWWDDDDWSFQYAERPPYNEPVEGFETPLLIYVKGRFKSMLEMFGGKFDDLLKNWFESTYGLRVKDVVDDWSAEVFVRA